MKRIEGANPILSVGFKPADADSRVVAANSLRTADSSLANAVRVTVHGLWTPDAATTPPAVHVSAFFNIGVREPVPFMAWSSAASVAPRVSFAMDLAGRDALSLGIERQRILSSRLRRGRFGRMLASDELPNATVLERGGGLLKLGANGMKLRRGTYFVALRETMFDRTPDWSAIAADVTDGDTVLRRGNGSVDFTYVAISVDAV